MSVFAAPAAASRASICCRACRACSSASAPAASVATWPLIERTRVPVASVAGANGPVGGAAPSAVTGSFGIDTCLLGGQAPMARGVPPEIETLRLVVEERGVVDDGLHELWILDEALEPGPVGRPGDLIPRQALGVHAEVLQVARERVAPLVRPD